MLHQLPQYHSWYPFRALLGTDPSLQVTTPNITQILICFRRTSLSPLSHPDPAWLLPSVQLRAWPPELLKLIDMQLAWRSSSSARSCNRMAVTGGKHAWYRKPYRPYTSPSSSTWATSRPERLAQAPKREQSQHTTRNKIFLQGMDEHTFWQHLQVHHHPASFPRLTSSQLVACFLAAICARLWLRASGTGCRQAASAVFTHMFPASPGG